MSLAEIIRVTEDNLRFVKDHEVAVVFDPAGNKVIEEHGGSSSVDFTPHLDRIKSVGKAVLVHNHPSGWKYMKNDPRHAGSSFTLEDIATACFAELAEIRAVTPLYRFVMRPPDAADWNSNYWINEIYPVLEKHKAAIIVLP